MKKLGKHLAWVVPTLIVASALIYWGNTPYRDVENAVREAKTEEDVLSRFGKPRFEFKKGDQNYYVTGYAHKKREITNKVLVYFPAPKPGDYHDVIVYVYIDESGRVEDYFVGGS